LPLLKLIGMYGVGFVLMSIAAAASILVRRARPSSAEFSPSAPSPSAAGSDAVLSPRGCAVAGGLLVGLAILTNLPSHTWNFNAPVGNSVRIAGVQLEFPGELEVLQALSRLRRAEPRTELFVLSEYTFSDEAIPARVRAWCHTNRVYLAAGGKDELPGGQYFNTIFVVDPNGEIIFQQAKKQPIQFFKDGLPASSQRVWDSPWGRLGICICYDLSYTRVIDELIRQGAQALIVPTMDVAEWGQAQHLLHSRVAPVRAAEYGVPIFRLASSGISQAVDSQGVVRASAPFPGDGAILSASLQLSSTARPPVDRWLAPATSAISAALLLWLILASATLRWKRKQHPV
jgi:apolipoprotein N-acyltransferase